MICPGSPPGGCKVEVDFPCTMRTSERRQTVALLHTVAEIRARCIPNGSWDLICCGPDVRGER